MDEQWADEITRRIDAAYAAAHAATHTHEDDMNNELSNTESPEARALARISRIIEGEEPGVVETDPAVLLSLVQEIAEPYARAELAWAMAEYAKPVPAQSENDND